MGRLDNKIAVVTGAGRGLGQAISLRLAMEGARVSVSDINESAARETADRITDQGGESVAFRCDVGSEAEVKAMVDGTIARFGGIDILVNDAVYVAPPTPLEHITVEQWDRVSDSAAKGSWLCAKAAFDQLRERKGRIINFGSIAGLSGSGFQGEYSSAKAAVMGLTRVMAIEWAKHGINVNAIAPAAATPGVLQYSEQVAEQQGPGATEIVEGITTVGLPQPLLGRIGDPYDDIAPVVVFLASEDARYITGQTICVDGGMYRL